MKKVVGILEICFFLGICFIYSEEKKQEVKKDETLTFYVPYDFNVDAKIAEHHYEGKVSGELEYVEGIVNKAILLKPPPELVEKNSGPSISYDIRDNIDPNEGTIMFWIKPNWYTDDGKKHTMIWVSLENQGYIGIFKEGKHNRLYFYSNPGDLNIQVFTDEFKKGKWLHITFTYSLTGKSIKCYLNGKLVGQSNRYEQRNSETYMKVGQFYSEGDNVDAAIDELYIYKRVLSEQEIANYVENCLKKK
ncbi:MAG: LamG domain-containing protein [Candidatus Omnitrophica bacterium]|nr:LamG domain-containing protein [Candidatus Omnitrophota bacterium]